MPPRRWRWGKCRAGEHGHCGRRRPHQMARAFRMAVEAGLLARESGPGMQFSGTGHQPVDRVSEALHDHTFTDRWRQLNWDDIALRINSKTQADGRARLTSPSPVPRRYDGPALSPGGEHLSFEPMAQRAQRLTRQLLWQHGELYAGLYPLTCANDCTLQWLLHEQTASAENTQ